MQPGSARFAVPAPDTAEEGEEASPEGGEGTGECLSPFGWEERKQTPGNEGRRGCQNVVPGGDV